MFEQFTDASREILVRAQQEARGFGHRWLGTEHLLLGVLAQSGAPGVNALEQLGVTLDTARAALSHLAGISDLGASAEALRSLGIDLDEVRRRVEAAFGPGALDQPPPQRGPQRRRQWRRNRCESDHHTGHLPFMPMAKRALERSLREALALGDRRIGVEHVLLGLLDPSGNMAVEVLRHLGAHPETVRARVLDGLGKAA